MKQIDDKLVTIYIDIDDTLTPDLGQSFFAGSIEKIKELSTKANIIIWSHGGLDYVNSIVIKAELLEHICMCMIKPDLIIDDLSFDKFSGHKRINNGSWDFELKLEGNWIEDYEQIRDIRE